MGIGERMECPGSGTEAPAEGREFFGWGSSWIGECPVCKGRFELAYGGLLPWHQPEQEADRVE